MVLLTLLLKYLLQKQQTELSHCAPAMHLQFKCIFIPTSSLLFSIEAGLPLGSLLLPVDRNSRSALKCKEHDKFFTLHITALFMFHLDREKCDFQRQTGAQQKRHSMVWHEFYRNNSEIPFSSVPGSLAAGEEILKHCKCNCLQK